MKVAILGSAGQIGAYLEEYLSKKGHDVIGCISVPCAKA